MVSDDLEQWIIPQVSDGDIFSSGLKFLRFDQSCYCTVRSVVDCYNLAHKFTLDAFCVQEGKKEIVFSLPYNAESAVLPQSLHVPYGALRLEVQ